MNDLERMNALEAAVKELALAIIAVGLDERSEAAYHLQKALEPFQVKAETQP